uniref:Large ribosomal subunit protein uL29c n=1 Tax=Dichotomaria marginata TaxID=268567 RepID=A0A1G4NSG5_9FLOR|nr:Ribosomal protein L29 [Dichotomaria marginata]SCW21600.1 Ribosomal protein L29 [Dichotomaria marginata]
MIKLTLADMRKMTNHDIDTEILKIKQELFNFRMKLTTRQQVKPHLIKKYKRQLSQLMTIKHEQYFNINNQ